MASTRNLIVLPSIGEANYYIAYEGTSGEIPFALQGKYTTTRYAQEAINQHLASKANKPTGVSGGTANSK